AELKLLDTGDFGAAWGGISSLQLGLSLVWTEAVERGIDLAEVVGWMATAPAEVARVGDKGAIAVGKDADFAVFAPDEEWTVRARLTRTLLRGAAVDFDEPRGALLSAR